MHLLYAADHPIDAYLTKALREAGHVVDATDLPADGAEMAATGDYQAMVLDWTKEPSAWVRALRPRGARRPDDGHRVAGGARRPRQGAGSRRRRLFHPPAPIIELEARLEALARLVRRGKPTGDVVGIELVAAEQAIRLNGQTIPLSAHEFHLLEHLLAHAGEVIGVERLQQHVWGDAADPRPDLVRTCVSRVRRKLRSAGAGDLLRNVAGHGYVLEARA